MHDEAGFLTAIQQTPADDTARLVFADWLDEQDDPISKRKAAFIRLELQMATSREKGSNRIRQRKQLQQLASTIEPAWLAVVSHPKLEGCWFQFQPKCPKQWEQLAPTGDPKMRFCEGCRRNIHYCDTMEEAQNHIANRTCVALSLAVNRGVFDLRPPRPPRPRFLAPRRLGRILPHRMRPGSPRPIPASPAPSPLPAIPSSALSPIESEDASLTGTVRKQPRRQQGRRRNRNLQRENWEELE
jgi:uncharacterized protein (TIGR02996 family)